MKEGESERKEEDSVKRSRDGYETNSDLIWRVYDSVFCFFQALGSSVESDGAVASDEKRGRA